MSKKIIALASFIGVLILCGLIVFMSSKDTVSPKDEPTTTSSIKLADSKPVTLDGKNEAFYSIENTSAKPFTYVQFKPVTLSKGKASIYRCSKAYEKGVGCPSEETLVLPAVDLSGWQNYLAGAATALRPGEKGYYKMVLSPDAPKAVALKIKAKN